MEMGRRTITRFSGGVNRGLRIEKCEYGVHLSLKEYVAPFFYMQRNMGSHWKMRSTAFSICVRGMGLIRGDWFSFACLLRKEKIEGKLVFGEFGRRSRAV